jgi:pantothenate kinase
MVLIDCRDGYHLSLEELAKLPDADEKIYRRGATDTFNPAALARDLERIAHGKEATVHIPGFDHALGDPVTDQHVFERERHRVVICEGLYLLHDKDGWEHIQKFLDWTIFIEADVDVCIDRLKERNKCIPGYTPEQIEIRCEEVDRVNAELASLTAGKYASMVVKSGAILPAKGEDECEMI